MRERISGQRWSRLDTLFERAVELPAERWAAFAETECAGDIQLRDELLSLLHYDTGGIEAAAEPDFADALGAGAVSFIADGSLEGKSLGAYRIGREVGRGGMSVVYLAARDDGQFRRNVAVKLIKRGMDTDAVLARLRRERRILAALEHPYIARLLDGGTTPDGRPYIVMEYVEGLPLHRYCLEHGLSVSERSELLEKICAAVAYAHQNLVVHRDLKPANILVTADGTPRLLDFGVAKVLAGDAWDQDEPDTRNFVPAFTPEYASPEQRAGETVGTLSDVYSLGVILRQLLIGYPVPGDLESIIRKATEDAPEQRYSSVEQFEADLARWRQGLPVMARPASLRYRAGKFLRRHRVGAIAAALVVASLISGMAATMWQAKRAEGQRRLAEQQRELARREADVSAAAKRKAEAAQTDAESQRAAAQKRLQELILLGNTALYDVQAALERTSGMFETRRKVIDATVKYLDGLSAEANDDPELLHLLGTGYTQVGDVLGVPERPNLGDREGALAAWAKARSAIYRLEKLQPDNYQARLQDLGIDQRIGLVDESVGNIKGAVAQYTLALRKALVVAAQHPKDPPTMAQPGIMHHFLAMALLKLNDLETAKQHIREEIRIYEAAVSMAPNNAELTGGLGSAYAGLARIYIGEGDLNTGLAQLRRSHAVRAANVARHPDDPLIKSGLASSYERIGLTLGAPWEPNMNDRPAATAEFEKAIPMRRELMAEDPANRRAKAALAACLVWAGAIDPDANAGLLRLREGAAALAELHTADPKQADYASNLALAQEYIGNRLAEAGDRNGAIGAYRLSLDTRPDEKVAAKLAEIER